MPPGALVRMQIGRAPNRAVLLLVMLCDHLGAVEQDRPNHAVATAAVLDAPGIIGMDEVRSSRCRRVAWCSRRVRSFVPDGLARCLAVVSSLS